MRRRVLALLVSLLALGLAAPAAHAAWFGAEVVDGPAPITRLGGVSLGRDGTGAVAYVKQEGDNPAGYIARFAAGVWGKPERLPANGVTDIAVAAGTNGRLALVWVANGNVFGAVADGRPGAPVSAPVQLSNTGGASGLDVQIGVEGGAFAVWSQGGDVRAAMLETTTWTAIAPPLDIVPARAAGEGAGRPKVAVAADDTAVVTWGELDASGRSHVYYRRLLGTTPSLYPQEASVPALGGAADTPEIDVEYDRSFAWVTFRQITGGVPRTFARRLLGSTFDPAFPIDNGVSSSGAALAMNPVGEGLTVAQGTDNSVLGSLFADKTFEPVIRLDVSRSTAPPTPVATFSDRGDGALAYRSQASDGSAVTVGRLLPDGKPEPAVKISSAGAGPVLAGTLRAGGDRVGDVAVAMLQQGAAGRYLTIALEDIPPARPVASARVRFVNPRTEGIKWNAGLDYLGPQTFTVRVDGRNVGTTAATLLRTSRIRNGRHRLQIVATDRRGQSAPSREFTMYVDTRRPKSRVTARRSGKLLRVSIAASDAKGRGSGVRSYTVDWGDGHTSTSRRPRLVHRYRTSGRKKIVVTTRDRARNRSVRRLRV
jgi:hypothetical protein